LEDTSAKAKGQRRFATIKATEEQHKQEINALESGAIWEKI